MAGYRQFHTKFWKDEWLIELEPMERYLFVYLFTNELTSIAGIYKLPLRVIENETGLDRDFITETLTKFQEAKKIYYQDGVMWVVKMKQYHRNASPRTMKKVDGDVSDIPDCPVKTAYLYYEKTGIYSIDTVSIPNSESVSESRIENESRSGTLPAAASFSNDNQVLGIYTGVTGMLAFPANEREARSEQIQALLRGRGEDGLIDYLKPYYQEWIKRKYNKSNLAWLDWAVAGETPTPKNGRTEPTLQRETGTVHITLPGGEVVEAKL